MEPANNSVANNSFVVGVPAHLEITLASASDMLTIRVFGQEQCDYTLQGTMDFDRWDDLTTRMITDGSFTFFVNRKPWPYRFFRAVKSP